MKRVTDSISFDLMNLDLFFRVVSMPDEITSLFLSFYPKGRRCLSNLASSRLVKIEYGENIHTYIHIIILM